MPRVGGEDVGELEQRGKGEVTQLCSNQNKLGI